MIVILLGVACFILFVIALNVMNIAESTGEATSELRALKRLMAESIKGASNE